MSAKPYTDEELAERSSWGGYARWLATIAARDERIAKLTVHLEEACGYVRDAYYDNEYIMSRLDEIEKDGAT